MGAAEAGLPQRKSCLPPPPPMWKGQSGVGPHWTWVDVLPQDQELRVILKLDQAHLPEGVHLWGGGRERHGGTEQDPPGELGRGH